MRRYLRDRASNNPSLIPDIILRLMLRAGRGRRDSEKSTNDEKGSDNKIEKGDLELRTSEERGTSSATETFCALYGRDATAQNGIDVRLAMAENRKALARLDATRQVASNLAKFCSDVEFSSLTHALGRFHASTPASLTSFKCEEGEGESGDLVKEGASCRGRDC